MSTQITIEGRLVQGGVSLKPAKDMKGNPKLDKEGKQVYVAFMGIAVPKMLPDGVTPNPKIGEYYAAFDAEARANFPHLFPNGGACTHPRFANKWQDGDGVDSNGKSVATKPGFAGHWVISCETRYVPTCYARDSHGNLVQLPDPEKVIKKGYRVAVGVTVTGNGVEAGNSQAVPGLFVSPNIVLFVAPDTEIVSGPDPTAAFAHVQGVQNVAVQGVGVGGAAPGLSAPPMPGGAPVVPAGGPPMPSAAPTPAGGPPMPGVAPTPAPMPTPGAAVPMPTPVAAAPTYTPTAAAQGATVEQLLGAGVGWTIETLLAQGIIVKN